MRIFGLIGLLAALVIVGLLVKKQFATLAAPTLPSVPGASAPASPPAGDVAGQSRRMQQQYKQAIESAIQQPRPMPDGQ